MLHQLAAGFGQLAHPGTLPALLLGAVLGMAVALLPGVTLAGAMAIVAAFSVGTAVAPAVVLLGAMYASATCVAAWPAIVSRTPHGPADVPLLWDAGPLAQRGRTGAALGWSLAAAVGGAAVGGLALVAIAEPLAHFALRYGSAEHFAAIVLALACSVGLAGGSVGRALLGLAGGLALGLVGPVAGTGAPRVTFGLAALERGIDPMLALLGIYGLAGSYARLTREAGPPPEPAVATPGVRVAVPALRELAHLQAPVLRSALLGAVLGTLPGSGSALAAFVAYGIERRYGRGGARMGKGAPEGIVAPQAAAAASAAGSLLPALSLGIPVGGPSAVVLAAILLHGHVPGPDLFRATGHAVYTTFAAMFAAIAVASLAGRCAPGALLRLRRAPEAAIVSCVAACCLAGGYWVTGAPAGVWLTATFGVLGFGCTRLAIPAAPIVLGLLLGRPAEAACAAALAGAEDWSIFLSRPLSAALILAAVLVVGIPAARAAHRAARR